MDGWMDGWRCSASAIVFIHALSLTVSSLTPTETLSAISAPVCYLLMIRSLSPLSFSLSSSLSLSSSAGTGVLSSHDLRQHRRVLRDAIRPPTVRREKGGGGEEGMEGGRGRESAKGDRARERDCETDQDTQQIHGRMDG
jgi:hypothetical protein